MLVVIIEVDGRRFTVGPTLSGASIAALAGRDASYELWQLVEGPDPDRRVLMTDPVQILEGMKFYTVPGYGSGPRSLLLPVSPPGVSSRAPTGPVWRWSKELRWWVPADEADTPPGPGTSKPVPRPPDRERLERAAAAFLEKYAKLVPAVSAAFQFQELHLGPYLGDDWGVELEELRAALDPSLPTPLRPWEATAAQAMRDRDYYRGLVVQIGEMLGDAAYIADDGSRSEDVLCAKVPGLVRGHLDLIPANQPWQVKPSSSSWSTILRPRSSEQSASKDETEARTLSGAPPYQYLVLHESLDLPGVVAVHAAHAAGEACFGGAASSDTRMVALVAKDSHDLVALSVELKEAGILHSLIIETDGIRAGQATALATMPTRDRESVRKFFPRERFQMLR